MRTCCIHAMVSVERVFPSLFTNDNPFAAK
jgi:hypothetical protein